MKWIARDRLLPSTVDADHGVTRPADGAPFLAGSRMAHRSAASRSFLKRGAGFGSLHESPDTAIAGGRLVFRLFVVLAEFVRELV